MGFEFGEITVGQLKAVRILNFLGFKMEPSNYNNRGVPENLSRSPHRHSHQSQSSPVGHQANPSIMSPSDEKRYEERRQEELRRHLAHQHSPARLHMRIKHSYREHEPRQNSSSPLRPCSKPPVACDKRLTPRSIMARAPPPYHHTIQHSLSRGPSTHSMPPHAHTLHSTSGGLNNEYTSQLQNDNQQLQRRLNLVVAELDRVNREKIIQQNQLKMVDIECHNYQRDIDNQNRDSPGKSQFNNELHSQKQENARLHNHIASLDHARSQTLQKLNNLQNSRERAVQDSENMSRGLNTKVHAMRDLENRKHHAHERAGSIERQIMAVELDIKHHHQRLPDLSHHLDSLKDERDTLLDKLQNLNMTYEHAVKDISRERAQMEAHNRRHCQLMAAKAMEKAFETIIFERKQYAFNEFEAYCKFDKNCHDTLKRLTQVLLNCGHHQLKIGLKRWFQNALKPVDTRLQGTQLADSFHRHKLKLRYLKQWQVKYQQAASRHENKLKATMRIWRLKLKDCRKISEEFFTDWRIATKLREQQKRCLRIMLSRQETHQIADAFRVISHHNTECHHRLMEHCLLKNTADLQLMQMTFGQLKQTTTLKRRIRRNKLSHFLRSWRNAQAYQRLLWQQSRQLEKMKAKINKRTLSACFHAIRIEKEQCKLQLMNDQLNGNFNVAIKSLEEQLQSRSMMLLNQKKIRAFNAMEKQARCLVASYFHYWNEQHRMRQDLINRNFKMLLIRKLYQNALRTHAAWIHGTNFKKNKAQERRIGELTKQGQELTKDLTHLSGEVNEEHDRQGRMARAHFQKGIDICYRRFLKQGIQRWSDRVAFLQKCEDRAGFFIQTERKWLVKQAYHLYRQKVLQKRQYEKDLKRAQYFVELRASRTTRRIFNALCQYLHQYRKAKQMMSTLCNNIDLWRTKRFFRTWMDQGNVKTIQEAHADQALKINEFEQLNVKLGDKVSKLVKQQAENQSQGKQLSSQAKRVMANIFARLYYAKIERGFRKWNVQIECDKHRKRFVKGLLERYLKNMFFRAKSALQHWANHARREELSSMIQQETRQCNLATQQMLFDREKHNSYHQNGTHELKVTNQQTKMPRDRTSQIQTFIQNKSAKFHITDRKRAIFNAWKRHTNLQVAGCRAIHSALLKSFQKCGFDHIYRFARQRHLTNIENKCCIGLKRMFFKLHCGNAFDRWRQNSFQVVTSVRRLCDESQANSSKDHSRFVSRVFDQNVKNSDRFLENKRLKTVFVAWLAVHKWQKAKRVKTDILNERSDLYIQKRALLLLAQRVQQTRKAKAQFQRLQERVNTMWKKSVFNAILECNRKDKNLSSRLASMAFKMDAWMKERAVMAVREEASLQACNNSMDKRVAALNLMGKLHQMYLLRVNETVSELRKRTFKKKTKFCLLKSALGHFASGGLRRGFFKWKRFAFCEQTVEEVNEVGPVVEEVLSHKMRRYNIKGYVEDQAYTPKEIQDICQWAEKRQQEHLARGVARIKMQKDDNYLKPLVFDRWRQFVKHRQVIKQILQNIENKMDPRRADLSHAFNRWKFSKRHLLAGIDRRNLMAKCGNDERHKQQLNSLEDSATQFMTQMEIQRDELIENYIKSQRLAVASARDQQERAQRRAFETLGTNCHEQKKQNLELILSRNINLIQSLKDRIRGIEHENNTMADENEELRQFSLDGYQIAKNVQSLSAERESLSVDLADKSRMIQKLLDQNQELSEKLKEAQERAIRLINQSQAQIARAHHPTHHHN